MSGSEEEVEEQEQEEVEVEVGEGDACLCLFCSKEQPSASDTLDHCRAEHDVDLLDAAAKLG